MSEIIFEVSEDEIDDGYSASALGYGIHTEGETIEEIRGTSVRRSSASSTRRCRAPD